MLCQISDLSWLDRQQEMLLLPEFMNEVVARRTVSIHPGESSDETFQKLEKDKTAPFKASCKLAAGSFRICEYILRSIKALNTGCPVVTSCSVLSCCYLPLLSCCYHSVIFHCYPLLLSCFYPPLQCCYFPSSLSCCCPLVMPFFFIPVLLCFHPPGMPCFYPHDMPCSY